MSLDFQPWDQLLNRYVDDRGRVDYGTWKQESWGDLDSWIRSLETIPLPPDPDTQMSFWINLYNALTIQQVLKRYPISSIRASCLGLPNWISFLMFFERKIFTLGGEKYSLNRIEHKILREQFQEHRIHFALVCASIGCPLLRNQAYWPDQIDQQLEEDTIRFINNPPKVRFDPDAKILYCSKIFKWYRQDFLGVSASIQSLISSYLKQEIPAAIPIRYLPYSWDLNQQI